jgi:hypothetical protein
MDDVKLLAAPNGLASLRADTRGFACFLLDPRGFACFLPGAGSLAFTIAVPLRPVPIAAGARVLVAVRSAFAADRRFIAFAATATAPFGVTMPILLPIIIARILIARVLIAGILIAGLLIAVLPPSILRLAIEID